MFYLDQYKFSDATQQYEILQQKVQGYWCGFKPPVSLEESINYIELIINGDTYAIRDSATNILIGNVSLKKVADNPTKREFGYWMDTNYSNQGIMSKVVMQLIDSLQGSDIKELEIHFFDGNVQSEKIAKKCGFSFSKTIDNYYLELLDEYRIKHIYSLDINC